MAADPRITLAPDQVGGSTTLSGCLARFIWMLGGNAALLILAVTILLEPRWRLSTKDALFWLVVAAMIAVRLLDVTRLRGLTVSGEPATLKHFWIYTGALAGISGLLWILAQSFQILS